MVDPELYRSPVDPEDMLTDLKIPPRGNVAFHCCTWERAHETVYIVQVASLDDARDMSAILTTVLIAVMQDAESEGLDFVELVSKAEEVVDNLEKND